MFYVKKATEEMDRVWKVGKWSEAKNLQILKVHVINYKGIVMSNLQSQSKEKK